MRLYGEAKKIEIEKLLEVNWISDVCQFLTGKGWLSQSKWKISPAIFLFYSLLDHSPASRQTTMRTKYDVTKAHYMTIKQDNDEVGYDCGKISKSIHS